MQVKISPSYLSGNVTAPASKSAMQRACALALMHTGETIISNPGISDDDKAAQSIIQALGARLVTQPAGTIKITGFDLSQPANAAPPLNIHCGESGLSIRMFAAIAAISAGQITITGSGSLANRPMDFFDDIFPQLGIQVKTNHGKLPLNIKGPLKPTAITIDGSLSSQFLTGLLFAFANTAREPVVITVLNLKSKPYIDLSLQMLKYFGYNVEHSDYQQFIIQPRRTPPHSITYQVEGDWSGAAFLLVAGALSGKITITGLDVFSAQADKAILQALMATGAILSINESYIAIQSSTHLKPFHFNATDCPDLFPPLVALAAFCDGSSVIEGVSRLAHKESHRALTLQEEFGKLGVNIKLQDDLMIIEGGETIKGAAVSSRHDHRIAMALAVAGLRAVGDTIISDAAAISKSYPAFFDDLRKVGATVNSIS